MTKTTWYYSPGSRQHWLHKGSAPSSRIIGMVYEVSPTAFTVYREHFRNAGVWSSREFLATMPTLDEAKDLLQTITGAEL
jgi:hypothetical protein